MAIVKGSITGTGATESIIGDLIGIRMDFGSGSVDVEVRMAGGGAWIKAVTGVAADYDQVYDRGRGVNTELRLNCTSYTSAIAYELVTAS